MAILAALKRKIESVITSAITLAKARRMPVRGVGVAQARLFWEARRWERRVMFALAVIGLMAIVAILVVAILTR